LYRNFHRICRKYAIQHHRSVLLSVQTLTITATPRHRSSYLISSN
jgi:hypothetical protein